MEAAVIRRIASTTICAILVAVSRVRVSWTVAGAALLIVALGLVSTQAIATTMTVTAEPLQNPTADGSLEHLADWSGVSAVTRHESTDVTLSVGDEVTTVTVQGTKASGAVDITVELKDTSGTILDNGTSTLPSAAGSYSTAVGLNGGTTLLRVLATVAATYASGGVPTNLTLNPTDGWDEKNAVGLVADGSFALISSSDNTYFLVDTPGGTPGYFMSVQFDQTVPTGATVNSVNVYIEHYEDNGFKAGEVTWEVGTGSVSSPTVLGSTIPTVLNSSGEAVVAWDVSTIIDTVAEANDMKVKIVNNSTNGKKVYIDHVYVVVNYTP